MVEILFAVGLAVAIFVGFNVGGSNTGVAFGPAVGSQTISKLGAASLMSICALVGGWTVGRNVINTMGGKIVPSRFFTLEASIAVLFFIGLALFLSNIVGVPASTSMTGVGTIAGLGLATDALNWAVMREIVSWWLVSPVIAFWVSAVIGRYWYPTLLDWFAITQTKGSLIHIERSGWIVRPALGPNTTMREFVGTLLVLVVACYTAFSAGASNMANAIAPLVGSGAIDMNYGILIAGAAIALGAFTIARRTIDTMGNELTDMPLLAALVVAVVSSTLITVLSALGIPASIVIVSTMSIVGLGWGRATRVKEYTRRSTMIEEGPPGITSGALAVDTADTPTIDEAKKKEAHASSTTGTDKNPLPAIDALYKPWTTARVIAMQNIVPGIATVSAYLLFEFVPLFS
ncbi:inorganic phosphate transporter, PiT family [Haladaptatus litoreus]|uniref:Phosphate transporter n=1 Tax=Haladaptatus litoreus TaxID=553468 RepID=A0A1N7CKK4_9EURY|nr:inorganic phosphate transporter [Haladaptatus litoreus]SIR64141.1 inorganic phosphate transporter, PiT family [Haladaptatus litoreus]